MDVEIPANGKQAINTVTLCSPSQHKMLAIMMPILNSNPMITTGFSKLEIKIPQNLPITNPV